MIPIRAPAAYMALSARIRLAAIIATDCRAEIPFIDVAKSTMKW